LIDAWQFPPKFMSLDNDGINEYDPYNFDVIDYQFISNKLNFPTKKFP